jgi:hypothetical protein
MHGLKQSGCRMIVSVLAPVSLLLSPAALFAQSCALCYQSASSSGPRFIQALRQGILIMLFPPLLIMSAILFAAYRKRNQFNGDESVPREEFGLEEDSSLICEMEIRNDPRPHST